MTVGTNSPPYPETKILPPIDLNITWLLQSITENDHSKFSVDRSHAKCRTPRRNPDVNTAMDYFRRCYLWSDSVCHTRKKSGNSLLIRLKNILLIQFSLSIL
jgi:hypothetical protein